MKPPTQVIYLYFRHAIKMSVIIAVILLVGKSQAVIHTKSEHNYTEHLHLRHGVFFNMINSVHFVDEGFEFFVRINFLPFFEVKRRLETMIDNQDNDSIRRQLTISTRKLNGTIEKLFSFIYTTLDEEKKIETPDVISSFNFTSHRNDVILELYNMIWPSNQVLNVKLANDNLTSMLLIEEIANQIEMDIFIDRSL